MKKIIAFAGSNSSKSINKQLATIASSYVEGAVVEILDLRDFPAPIYSQDIESNEGFPKSMVSFSEKIKEADGFIVSSPEHNGSMPAVFKNTIDWISRIGTKVFNDKPTVFLTTSPGTRGGASVLQHLLAIMPYQGAKIVGGHSLGSFNEKIDSNGLIEGDDKEKIIALIKELSQLV